MEAQELLRKAVDIYEQSGNDAYAPKALAEAAGLDQVDIDNIDLSWNMRKDSIRRAAFFFLAIAEFLDLCEAEEGKSCDGDQDSVPCDDALESQLLPYRRAIESLAKARCSAVLMFSGLDCTLRSAKEYSRSCKTVLDARIFDHEYKSGLKLVASIFGKSIEAVRADVLNNQLSRCCKGYYDEY